MALTLNNFTGFETQGGEEASAVSSVPEYDTTNQRSGNSCLSSASGLATFDLPWVSGVTDAGMDYVFGFAVQTSLILFNTTVIRINDDSGGIILQVDHDQTGAFELIDAEGNILNTSSVLALDEYHYIEVYAQLNNGSASWEWFINDASEGSGSGADLTDGNAFGSSTSTLQIQVENFGDMKVDDVYILSGATAASDRFGDFAVKAYQNTVEDATDQGDTLADGTWALVSETPGVESDDGTANALYQDTGNLAGSTICDEGTRSGPSGDGDVTGTIKGAKWIGNFKRGTGGGRVHEFWVGNDADWITTPTTKTVVTLSLETAYAIVEKVLEASDASVPTTSDFFQHGFSKSATAGQDIFCAEIWAMLGYVPAAGAVPVINLVMAPYVPA